MTLGQIAKEIARRFEVDVSDMISLKRDEQFVKARHIWRTIAVHEFLYTPIDVAKFELLQRGKVYESGGSESRAAVYSSIEKIVNERIFEQEYESALKMIRMLCPAPTHDEETIVDDGITRVTQEEFDSRFYGHPTKINPVSNNNWFPSWHYLYGKGAPTNDFLVTYYKSKGFFSDFEFHRAEVMGSYVHNRIEDMGAFGIDTTIEQIDRAFSNPKEARRVKECLQAWLNFVKNEEPQVLSYEQKVIAEDWGGTVDLRARIKSDNYENVWTIDFKTSKSVYDSHKSQVECYRRQFGDGKAAVLLLGNSTKNKYTLSEVKEKDRDFWYQDFINIKQVAYHRLKKDNRLEPYAKDMPDVFTLKGLNITKL